MEKSFFKGKFIVEIIHDSFLLGIANDGEYFYLVIGIFAFGIKSSKNKEK
jgi:hypothetical protein